MSSLLQRIMIALGRRGVQTPIDQSLSAAYRALQHCHEQYPSAFPLGADILLAEIEGGATAVADIPKRIGHIVQMLDRLHREEELAVWAEEQTIVVV